MTWGVIGAILSYTLLLTRWWISLKHLALAERVCRAVVREKKAAEALGSVVSPYDDEYYLASDRWADADKALDEALREWEGVRG